MSKRERPPRGWVIAVDGPAGAGKSSAARGLARALGYRHVDTGAMYRAAAWAVLRAGSDPSRENAVMKVLIKTKFDFSDGKVEVDGRDAAGDIRTAEAGQAASRLAVLPRVRRLLVARQRRMGRGGGVVMEGRDVGTVVFPRARMKFFLDATPEERARRRWKELRAAGRRASLTAILTSIKERDERDRSRAVSPLRAAADAVVVDTTRLTLPRVRRVLLERVLQKARR